MSYEVTVLGEVILADLDLDSELIEALLEVTLFDAEYELVYDVSIGREAFISGPPEKCYPAEGDEIELQSNTWDLACGRLESVKHLFTLKDLFKMATAVEKQIKEYADSDRAQEDAQCKAHEINSTPPDCDYERDDD